MVFMQGMVIFNIVVAVVFTVCYSYQFFYLLVPFLFEKRNKVDIKITQYKYAVIIAARNEEQVISQLIASVKGQNYPQDRITVFVIADNCTDNTAKVAREAGAVVWERFSKTEVGKGYALNFIFGKIFESYGTSEFDGFFVFDADNLLDENYISEMNKTFNAGHKIITSYRNSKNYASNWISAGYSLWFLRESKYMNNARMLLKTGCAISGTGFFVSADIILQNGGWPFHLLTEDIEFSNHNAIEGNKIAYCGTAILYDEQPTTFRQSWNQRMRWAKGFYQVFGKYGLRLVKSITFKRDFYAYDMFMTILPGMVLTSFTMAINILVIILGLAIGFDVSAVITLSLRGFLTLYAIVFAVGTLTTITEWKKIHCKGIKKIIYLFTFPLFMFTYMPIAIVAMFRRVEWKPIKHNASITLCGMSAEKFESITEVGLVCPHRKADYICPPGCTYFDKRRKMQKL